MSDDKDVGVKDEKVIDATNQTTVETREEIEERRSAQDYKKSKDGAQLSMAVKVYSPFRDYFDGQAFSITVDNLTGPFDVLPKHHNFISLLIPCDVLIRTPNDDASGPIRIRITGGIMHVKADQVIVFLDV